MSREIYVISDHHWQHKNILTFKDSITGNLIRPGFADVDEMNEHMIDKWNSVVRDQDHVWHLGDIAMGDYELFKTTILPRLKGIINILVGNHDDVRNISNTKRFKKIALQRRFDEFGLYLTHIPINRDNLFNRKHNKFMRNVHGHIHQNKSPREFSYVNVSVEAVDYTPVNIETLRIW